MADAVTITSTTDTVEDARAALGLKPAEPAPVVVPEPAKPAEPKVADKAPEPVAAAAPAAAPVDDDDDEAPTDAEASEAGAKLAKLAKKSRYQTRIDDLVRTKATSERERDEAFDKIKALEAKIVALDVPREVPKVPATVVAEVEKPQPKETDFDTYTEYVQALTDWMSDKKVAKFRQEVAEERAKEKIERQRSDEMRAVQERQAAFNKRAAKARETYTDYDAVTTQAKDLQVSAIMVDYLRDAEMGPELHYYFASNPDEALKLSVMSERATLVALGRLEAKAEEGRLNAAPKPSSKNPDQVAPIEEPMVVVPKVPVSSAPPPAPVVGSSVTIPAKDPDKMSFSEFKAWRLQQRKAG